MADRTKTEEKWPSYTMVDPRMRKIYFQFYQETYKPSALDRKTKELVAIAAVGLLLGFCGFKHCHYGIPALGGGLILGLAMGFTDAAGGTGSGLLFGIALVAAATVTAGIGLPVAVAAVLALVGGFAVGSDAQPEAQSFPPALLMGTATALSGTVVGLVVAAVVLSREKFWQEVAVRVAGSWITASGMLYFSWRLVGPSE